MPKPPDKRLDLSSLGPIYVSATHFEPKDLHALEEELIDSQAQLTYDITEAKIIISKVTKRARVLFDLRSKGLWTEEVHNHETSEKPSAKIAIRPNKRRKVAAHQNSSGKDASQPILIDDSSTASGGDSPVEVQSGSSKHKGVLSDSQIVTVVTVDWLKQSKASCTALPLSTFTTYTGRRTERLQTPPKDNEDLGFASQTTPQTPVKGSGILDRAREDASETPSPGRDKFGRRKFGQLTSTPATDKSAWSSGSKKSYAHLLHQTTTEEEDGFSSELPEMPEWVKSRVKYACQRVTPRESPNAEFITLLKRVRLGRTLTNDEIGVRAYSTSIAALAAYPYKVTNPREILALPGCEGKIANLFVEWANTGQIQVIQDFEENPDMKVLRLFYDIWGVGASTAREFYFDRGWRDLDDIVEYGWSTLTRVQQIGVKYYDEFLDPIPRAEVEEIGRIIHAHAVKVRDKKIQSLIVGGYRRGKEASGDVDVIISHPDEQQTASIITEIVESLEDEGWITHTLTLSTNNTRRDQQTLPFRTSSLHGGASFDSLDKALVVWQDPEWPTKAKDLAANAKAKNPNIHRRVDIIISPWRTVGCSVVGWSGATTFERDLRRFAKNVKGWKFDSSGVRNRGNGEVIDIEGFHSWGKLSGEAGRAKTMLEAERRVFQGFGLEYREPWERCTE